MKSEDLLVLLFGLLLLAAAAALVLWALPDGSEWDWL